MFRKMSDPSTVDSPDVVRLPPEILLLERADFVGVGMSQMLYGNEMLSSRQFFQVENLYIPQGSPSSFSFNA